MEVVKVWDVDKNGGAILDSDTSLAILATPTYKNLVAVLSKQLEGLPRVEYCYNWMAGMPEIPNLEVHFAGSARLEPPAKSYVIDAAPGKRQGRNSYLRRDLMERCILVVTRILYLQASMVQL
ncbi:hypothetical protein C2845_PM01G17800 [Panicum miliaceum]|uniref:Xylanase inhibitor C-terminal domain-containing protein n=1 Tax=Panicum miliaceum TaxID=4540 RepID=A0A3L6TP61_PANMI|nr:hypothetical protein C2845_PM01G17800 [Panicum miliaceum]